MKDKITLRQWITNFESGKYVSADIHIQCEAGWYDWFCKSTSLAYKTKVLGKKFLQIKNSSKINLDTMYIFFKNNAPMAGHLYDDFRICDIETSNVLYTVVPAEGYTSSKGQSSVWGHENSFKIPLVQGSWADVLNFFNK